MYFAGLSIPIICGGIFLVLCLWSLAFISWFVKDVAWKYHVWTKQSQGITNVIRTREWEFSTDIFAYQLMLLGLFCLLVPIVARYYFVLDFVMSSKDQSYIPLFVVGVLVTGITTILFLYHWYIQWFRRDTAWELHRKRVQKQNDETYQKTNAWQIFTTITGLVSLILGIAACCAFWYLLLNMIEILST